MKRLVSVISAVAIAAISAFSLASCKKSGTVYDPDNFLTAEQAEELGTPYKIVKESVTIKIFVPRGSMNPPYSEMRTFKKLSQLTNLNFKFIEADESEYMTQRTLAWEDKSQLPDLFLFNNTISEIVTYSGFNALTPINDENYTKNGVKIGSLLDYMPVYKKLLDDNFGLETKVSIKDTLTLSDGKMYSTASVNDVPRDLTYKTYINQRWIDNVNENFLSEGEKLPAADEIRTVEQYLTVLRAFKKYDANLNDDPDDEIPVTAEKLNFLRNFILQAYGRVSPFIEINDAQTEFKYTAATEAYKKYLETIAIMYKEKLLDNTTFSATSTNIASKGFENKLGSFVAAAAYIVVDDELDKDYTTLYPLTSEYYTGTPVQYSHLKADALGAVIPSDTVYSREIARLLDIMYSDLGVQLLTFGEENVDWKWLDESKTSWVKTVPESWTKSEEEYRATLSPNVGLGVGLYNSNAFVSKESGSYTTYLNKLSEKYTPYLKEPIPAFVKLTGEEYGEEALIGSSLENCVKEWEIAFVKGEKTVAADWDSYLAALGGYRYKDLEKIYNDALKRCV